MHEEKDFDAEFSKIIEGLGDLANPQLSISLPDISRVVEHLNEAALYLGKYITKVMEFPRGTPVDFPDEMMNILPPLVALCAAASDLIHSYVCDCGDCDCDEEDCEVCHPDDEDEQED